jgi:hypothetical protein
MVFAEKSVGPMIRSKHSRNVKNFVKRCDVRVSNTIALHEET